MFAEAIEEILKDQCTPAVVRSIEAGASAATFWDAIVSAGYLELLTPEDDGGAGLPLPELFPILAILGQHAMPAPIAQSIAARALLAGKAEIPAGMITLASGCQHTGDGRTICPITQFGMLADHVLADDAGTLVLLSCEGVQRSPTGVHGSLAATLTWNEDTKPVRVAEAGSALPAFAAAVHAALLSGAMSRVFEMTMQYANDRIQFGKSIGKFQAIQHQMSVMAEHVAASSIAAEAAFATEVSVPSLLAAAIAKSRTSEASVLVASIAHAVHGAIGVTEEFDLQLLTRRMHEWRMAHGSEAYWNLIVGRSAIASELPTVTDFVRSVGA